VVATDVAGNRALIENMRTGILVPRHDAELLLEACERLAASPDLRQQLGGQAREEMHARYGCEAELRALESLYTEILTR
jgi:glycosyltransferase involved in cell wall biosynthesis